MCFHVSQVKKEKELEKRFDAAFEYDGIYEPYYHFNGWENKSLYIITQDDPYIIKPSYWGLMPNNIDISERKNYLGNWNTLNARSERVLESSLFRKPTLENRCLILVSGFFEPHQFQGKKYPYFIRCKNQEAFAMAGIYNHLEDDIYTASILTTTANDYFKRVHNNPNRQGQYRMPIILDKSEEIEWLNPDLKEGDIKEQMMFSFTKEDFEDYPVSKDLFSNKIDSDRADIVEPFYYAEMHTLF
ncbi:putative SOS response-associated peptidase YedK [Kordia sp. SMS9]|uniref:SOS response-associated peptidase n=1 Tax=Kordia sp. SMS9 TaxID=2282170 RepID=UPI000E0D396A|nr:SOS response-associated peptidase [Kordia sp. SMS9]AXG68187.1 putative SOS response-associated peptidase YedK [Kordia sp. SMS9]